eukprot:5466832-Pyramimonas_sp.AAC.1
MRTKLWKCSVEQVREATRAEALGAELVDTPEFRALQAEVRNPGKKVGALDVESEGSPPDEAWDGQDTIGAEAGGPVTTGGGGGTASA